MRFPFSRTVMFWVRKRFLYKSAGWVFSDYRLNMFLGESVSWSKWYLPVDVVGKVVLDVGAGEGESARFFLEHGAKKVVCIECDDKAFENLRLNAVGRAMVCLHKRFELSDLDIVHDFLKVDIEGCESVLLDLDRRVPVPCVVELHSEVLAKAFWRKGYILRHVMGCGRDVRFRLFGLCLRVFEMDKGWLCYAY